jgi:hypothetical protein
LSEATALHTGADTVGYIVLSHQNPSQVMRLVDRLVRSDPTGHVIVEHDPMGGALDLGMYAGHDRVHLLTSSSVRRWGNYALVADLLRAVSWTLAELDVEWLAVLSGQDYPLRPLASFGRELAASEFDAFLSARPIPLRRPPASDSPALYAHARYYYRWFRLPRWLLGWAANRPVERWVRGAQRRFSGGQPLIFLWSLPRGAGDMIGLRRRKLLFSDAFECYMGSQWLTMSRAAALEVTRFVEHRPDVVALYRRSIISDESLLVTVLCNSPGLRVCHSNHHYMRMSGPGESHAAVLRLGDLEQLRQSGKPFARKFDARVDNDVLDSLDLEILARAR